MQFSKKQINQSTAKLNHQNKIETTKRAKAAEDNLKGFVDPTHPEQPRTAGNNR